MIAQLKDGDRFVLVPNLTKDGNAGQLITPIQSIYHDNHLLYNDNDNFFNVISKNMWANNKRPNQITKYYAYVILNGEYKLIIFGRTIMQMFEEQMKKEKSDDILRRPRYFQVHITLKGGFRCYDDSYFTDEFLEYDLTLDFVKTKTLYLEDHFSNKCWLKYKKVMESYLEENGLADLYNNHKIETRMKKLDTILK